MDKHNYFVFNIAHSITHAGENGNDGSIYATCGQTTLNAQILDDIANELATFVVNDKASGIKCLNDSNISHLMIFITLQRN